MFAYATIKTTIIEKQSPKTSDCTLRGLTKHISLYSISIRIKEAFEFWIWIMERWTLNFLFWQILTKDSVTVTVDAVVYWRTSNPMISVINVENASRSTQLLAQTTLRNTMGTKTLAEILSEREEISSQMQVGYPNILQSVHSMKTYLSIENQMRATFCYSELTM